MTVRGGFFNSINGDRPYNAADMNMPYKYLISNGVIPNKSDALQVVAQGGLTVAVKTGGGLFGDGWAYNDADVQLTLDESHPLMPRIDLIVMRRDDNEDVRATDLYIKKGTPASNPVAPTVERSSYINEYALAEIRIAAEATAISQSNITDTREDPERCGWVTAFINHVVKGTLSLTLPSSGWTANADGYYYQTVAASNLTADDIVIVSAPPDYTDINRAAGVICTAQDNEKLTFRATVAVAAKVNVLNLGGI